MERFARGSEWRKWDLHVHTPGTKLTNGYAPTSAGDLDWDRFCQIVHDSDVDALGITDYFSLDGFFEFKERYTSKFPESRKVFFPNLELRLNETVNGAAELVHIHIVFRPDWTRNQSNRFLSALKTQQTNSNRRAVPCIDLAGDAFDVATVSRADISEAIDQTIGGGAVRQDHMILIAAANNDGIRATGSQRKRFLADEIDKFVDALFGNPGNFDYYLRTDRLEVVGESVAAKPVFGGCDAHTFEELDAWLGAEAVGPNSKQITWVKADLTFEGLLQTLVEPSERVRIQALRPDKKEPYKVLSKIKFPDNADFPAEVVFNPGLNAIIGSRSSGKSALLSYIAHAVDPTYTVQQQVLATGAAEGAVGPGASVTWAHVKAMEYSVEWAASTATKGRVIYVPQNALYKISERPADITAKIKPAVFRGDAEFAAKSGQVDDDLKILNESISRAIANWFDLGEEIREFAVQAAAMGDREAVATRRDDLVAEIEGLRASTALTPEDVASYQKYLSDDAADASRLEAISQEQKLIGPYVVWDESVNAYVATDKVVVKIGVVPTPATMPQPIRLQMETLLRDSGAPLQSAVEGVLIGYRLALDVERQGIEDGRANRQSENASLIERNVANSQMADRLRDQQVQEATLASIDALAKVVRAKSKEQRECLKSITSDVAARTKAMGDLLDTFALATHSLERMTFEIELGYDPGAVDLLSQRFNRVERCSFFEDGRKRLDMTKVLGQPDKFVEHMGSGKQKLVQGQNPVEVTSAVLTALPDVRYVACLEGDRIGGFETSSMTPGKQALFALILILGEAGEPWPLLIDQPEDDLDSRSVCEVIVPDLMRRKHERQIIMVSHNANLVIGADSEEVIVANRHGVDRPNRDARMFAYMSGSLEHSKPRDSNAFVLESAGIREHACEILDGGAEAFQKRKDKYRI